MTARLYRARIVVDVPLVCASDLDASLAAERVHYAVQRTARLCASQSTTTLEAVRDDQGHNIHERGAIGASARDGG